MCEKRGTGLRLSETATYQQLGIVLNLLQTSAKIVSVAPMSIWDTNLTHGEAFCILHFFQG